MGVPQVVSVLDVREGGRYSLPNRVDAAHQGDDVAEQRDDHLQLVAGDLRGGDHILEVANDAVRTYV